MLPLTDSNAFQLCRVTGEKAETHEDPSNVFFFGGCWLVSNTIKNIYTFLYQIFKNLCSSLRILRH